jgi:predicted nucleic acid-binding Zn ribbon protein
MTTAPQKFCVNCKHFIPSQTGLQFGKCALFEREDTNHFLVTGVENKQDTHNLYCQTARNDERMCGEEGKMYTRKYTKRVKKISDVPPF